MDCPTWCQLDESRLDPGDGAVTTEHRALVGTVDGLMLTIVQLEVVGTTETEVEIRRSRGELLTLSPDAVQLRVLAGLLDRAAIALGG